MPKVVTSLSADDVNGGASEWLSSRPRRFITAGLGTLVGLVWAVAVVCSLMSWSGAVPVAPTVMVKLAAFAALPAVLWLAGNLFRLVNLSPRAASYNPLSRINLSLYALLLGLTRPSRRTVAFSILTLAISVAVIALNARHGWDDDVATRIVAGRPQVSYDDGGWAAVSQGVFRSERAAEFRSAALAALFGDTVLMLSMVGLYRLEVDGDHESAPAVAPEVSAAVSPVVSPLRRKRRA